MPFGDRQYDNDAALELAKTRLRVDGDELQRRNANGGVLLRLPLADVADLELRAAFDPVCLVFLAAAAAVAAIAFFVSEYVILTSLLYLGAVALAVLACFGTVTRRIVVRTSDGETQIQCDDNRDEAEGFVLSVRHLLRKRGETRPRLARHPDPDTGFHE